MSLAAYQRAQVAMIVDPGAAARLASGDLAPWADDLTPAERDRLVAQATDAGLALSRKLHQGWRLTKLLTLLPITFRVGDPTLLADLVGRYWREHRPAGLYFEAEAAAFAAYVVDQVPPDSVVHDAALLEGALLAVGGRGPAAGPAEIMLHLTHDPRLLLAGDEHPAAPPDDEPLRATYPVVVSPGPTGPTVSLGG